MEWPDCIRCESDNTVVVPKTGEWTCEDCGCQWTPEETPADDGDAADIPSEIARMLRALPRRDLEAIHRHKTEES